MEGGKRGRPQKMSPIAEISPGTAKETRERGRSETGWDKTENRFKTLSRKKLKSN
jgi:hypothetical protein